MTHYEHWSDTPGDEWRRENFTPEEMADRESGALVVVPEFLDRMQLLRDTIGQPLSLSSAYRTPEHNARISKTGTAGPHTTGRAVDILCSGSLAFEVIGEAKGLGFTGIGVSQKGPHEKRYLHFDDLEVADGFPRQNIWSY